MKAQHQIDSPSATTSREVATTILVDLDETIEQLSREVAAEEKRVRIFDVSAPTYHAAPAFALLVTFVCYIRHCAPSPAHLTRSSADRSCEATRAGFGSLTAHPSKICPASASRRIGTNSEARHLPRDRKFCRSGANVCHSSVSKK